MVLTSRLLRIIVCVGLMGVIPYATYAQGKDPCAAFQETIKATYNFRPALLPDEAARNKKSAEMDKVWKEVEAKPNESLPCLRKALEDPAADPWFRFDGSNLLVSLQPTDDSKKLQIKNYAATNLEDVHLMVWVGMLARLGAEGFNVSEPGERWLAFPKATYYLPVHGAAKVDKLLGAIFIFGSMDEAEATPVLLKIASSSTHPGREEAISLLLMQATGQAIVGLKSLNQTTLSPAAQASLQRHLTKPILIVPREKPKTTREQFLKAFNDAARNDWKYFLQLVSEVPDGEKDVVAVMKIEDIPLVRKVRRQMIARANPHAAEYYVSFTQILMTMISRPEMAK